MSAFYDRKYDVLLSTTIVESGLDIPSRQHPDRPPRRPLRPRPALPAARPRRPVEDPRLRLSDDHARPAADRGRRQAPAGAGQSRQPRRRLPARQPRPRHPRRRQSARRRAVGPHQGGRLRTLPVDAGGRDPRAEVGRRGAARGIHAADQRRGADPHPRSIMSPISTCAWASIAGSASSRTGRASKPSPPS